MKLLRLVQPQQAMAEIHDALTGNWQVLLRNLVEPVARFYYQTCLSHTGKVLGDEIGTAADALGDLEDCERFAQAQFTQNLPTCEGGDSGNDHIQ